MINEDLHQKIKKLPQDYAYLANYLLAQVSKGNKTQVRIDEITTNENKKFPPILWGTANYICAR